MVIGKDSSNLKCVLKIGNHIIKQVDSFRYLGTIIESNGRCDREIKTRIAIAKDSFDKMDKIFKSHKISNNTKLRLLYTYIYPILIYGSECWTISSICRIF